MALGTVTIFDDAKARMLDGDWASTDHIYCAICDDTTTPAVDDSAPNINGISGTSYTEVGASGSYIAGGTDLGTVATLVSQTSGTMTFDSTTNPTWAQHASNDTDAYWAILYNANASNGDALAFVDLDGPKDMSAGALTITWDGSGIFTISDA